MGINVNELSGQDYMIWKLGRYLRYEGMVLRESYCEDPQKRMDQMKVIEQLKLFLDDFETNMRIIETAHRPVTQEDMDFIEQEDMGYDGR